MKKENIPKSHGKAPHDAMDTCMGKEENNTELYDYIPLSYQSLDPDGCFLNINQSWLALLGYEKNEVIGKKFSDFLHPDYMNVFDQNFPRLKQNGRASDVRFKIRHKRGHFIDISLTANIRRRPDGSFKETFCVFQDITDQERTKEALGKSQRELRSIFRIAPTGIGVVKDRILYKVNDKLCEMTGYSREDLLGKSARMLYPSQKDFDFVGTEKYLQISQKGSGTVETRFKRKDGKIIDILMSSTPLNAEDLSIGVTFTALDITRRKNTERALRESEKKYRSIMESMADAAYICSPEYRIEFMNPAMEKMIGYDATGKRCHEVIFGIQKKCPKCFFDTVRKGEVVKVELLHKKQNKTYHISNSPIKNPDKTISMLTIFRDISEIKQMEERIQQSQKIEAIGTLAGGIAHDFNNILFPITGHSEILLSEVPEGSPLRESIQEIYSGAMRAKELVKQILTFSRQEPAELKIFKLQHIIKEALKLIRATIPSTIDIKDRIENTRGAVKADPTQIHQIVMNLCTNAFHAMEDKGGVLNVVLKEIDWGPADPISPEMEPGRYVLLSVSDNGAGIRKEVIEKIFDPFFTTKKKGKGTGMGLSVVHGIVTRMGGAIKVFSEPGKGTEFKLYFPAAKTSFEDETVPAELPVQGGNEHILLVDDEPNILALEKLALERLGYTVSSRSSSLEALEAFRAVPGKYDLVISDVAMPNLSGDKLAAEMLEIRPDMPILLCTGFSEALSEEKAAALGIRGILMKPIILKDLAQTLRRVLD